MWSSQCKASLSKFASSSMRRWKVACLYLVDQGETMRIVDTSISTLGGKTPRELLLLAVVGYAAYLSFGHWPEFITATGVAVLFALRVPQARPIAVGFCLGWLISMVAMMRGTHLDFADWDFTNVRIVMPAGILLLLTSRDLFERFDAAPSRIIPNVWRELPTRHWRMMRWCAYSLGVLSALVVPGWLWTSNAWGLSRVAPAAVVAAIVIAIALLVVGSALGFIVAAAVSCFVLIELGPHLQSKLDFAVGVRPGMLGPICVAALVVFLFAVPYCVRLVRRA